MYRVANDLTNYKLQLGKKSSHIVKRGHRKFEITCKLNY